MSAGSPSSQASSAAPPGEAAARAEGAAAIDLLEWLGPLSEAFPHARVLAEAWAGWRRAAGTALPPVRAVDPLDMVPALSWVWLWAMDDAEPGAEPGAVRGSERAGRLRLRLVGEEARRAIGGWKRGGLASEVVPAPLRPRVLRRYALVLDGPEGASALAVRGTVTFASGAQTPAFRLVLPLGAEHAGADAPPLARGLIGVTSYADSLERIETGGGLAGDAEHDHLLPVARVA